MDGAPSHIQDGVLLTVDCAIEKKRHNRVVAAVDGEFATKHLQQRGPYWWLVPDNPQYEAVEISTYSRFEIWGMVAHMVTERIRGPWGYCE